MSYLIHEHEPQAGGLGDLFRSILSHFALCKTHGIPFFVSLNHVPHLQACFTCASPSSPAKMTYTKRSIGDYDGTNSITDTIQLVQTLSDCAVKITSNGTLFHKKGLLQSSIHELMSSIIQPSPLVSRALESIFLQENIRPKQYVCVHVRTGDAIMSWEQNKKMLSSDTRFGANQDIVQDTFQQIQAWKEKYSITIPIYILSDSVHLRQRLTSLDVSLRTLPTEIQHIANGYGNNTVNSFCSTVTEFYFLQHAHSIFMPIYSGFSHIASVLGDCRLYTPIKDHCMFTHVGPSTIIHMDNESLTQTDTNLRASNVE